MKKIQKISIWDHMLLGIWYFEESELKQKRIRNTLKNIEELLAMRDAGWRVSPCLPGKSMIMSRK